MTTLRHSALVLALLCAALSRTAMAANSTHTAEFWLHASGNLGGQTFVPPFPSDFSSVQHDQSTSLVPREATDGFDGRLSAGYMVLGPNNQIISYQTRPEGSRVTARGTAATGYGGVDLMYGSPSHVEFSGNYAHAASSVQSETRTDVASTATQDIYFVVEGPDNRTVPLVIGYVLYTATSSNVFARSSATIELWTDSGNSAFNDRLRSNDLPDLIHTDCMEAGSFAACVANRQDTVQIRTNSWYRVQLTAVASAASTEIIDSGSQVPTERGTFDHMFSEAVADPFFHVDPTAPDVASYTLRFGAGAANGTITSVPEPAARGLMLGGLAALLVRRHKRR